MNWKILSSEYLVKRPYFSARKDKCQSESGKIIPEYYTVELDPTICALGITEDDKAVMIKQYRHPVAKTLLEIPGGFANENESAEKAIAREMLEETGYEFTKYEYLGQIAANPGVLNNYTKLFLATGGKKIASQNLDANEEIVVELIPMNDLIEMLLQNKIEQSMHANCIFYALIKSGRLKIS